MAPGKRDLETAPGLELTADLAQVRTGDAARPASTPSADASPADAPVRRDELDPARSRGAPTRSPCPDDRDRVDQGLHADHLDPIHEARLIDRRRGDHDPPQAAPREDGDHRQDARHRAHLPAERQLPDEGDAARSGHDLLRTEQDPDRHREVERRAGLALVGRGEIDRDPARWVDEPGVAQRASHPLPRLLQRGIGQPDDGEPGQPRRDVHLDPDEPAVEAVERRGWDDGQHARTLGAGAHPTVTPPLTPGLSAGP